MHVEKKGFFVLFLATEMCLCVCLCVSISRLERGPRALTALIFATLVTFVGVLDWPFSHLEIPRTPIITIQLRPFDC